MSNSSLTSRALRVNYETSSGGGGGFGATEGTRSTAGGVGTFACTLREGITEGLHLICYQTIRRRTGRADRRRRLHANTNPDTDSNPNRNTDAYPNRNADPDANCDTNTNANTCGTEQPYSYRSIVE